MKRFICMMFASVIILTGCTDNQDYYSDIPTIEEIFNDMNLEFYEYKGHGEYWATVYIVYKDQGKDNYSTKLYLKYIGKKPNPTGDISFSYDTDTDIGNGTVFFKEEPENGVYYLGSSVSNKFIPTEDTQITLQIEWDKTSEIIELTIE